MRTSEWQEIISRYPGGHRESLIPMLQDLQDFYGFLPTEALSMLADHLQLPEVKIYSVATYYNQFHFEPKAQNHLQVCGGTSCHLEGGQRVLNELERLLDIQDGEMTKDQQFSLEVVPCLGACHLAPVLNVNGKLYGQLNSRKLAELIDTLREN